VTLLTIAKLDPATTSIKAIVCDWNGTIVNDTDRALSATNRVLTEFRLAAIDHATFCDLFCLPLTDFARALSVPEKDCDQAIQLWNGYLCEGETRLQPGVQALFAAARTLAIPVGIVSAASETMIRRDAAALEIESHLDFVMGSVASKSNALREIGTLFGNPILYVGDTEYDILEAQKVGAVAIAFGGGYRPIPALLTADPVLVITDFTELSESLLRRLAECQ